MSYPQSGNFAFGGRLSPGTRLNGIFEIDHHVASGGMGEIYRGHAIETGDVVAIKVMRADLDDNETALALFRKEASALHYVHHDAIVHYYVFSLDPETRRHYLAMEFVDGEPLSEIIKRGPLSFEDVHQLRERLAAGLEAAHRRGVIHRDISPDNILIPGSDVRLAKIIDFGIARTARGGGTVIGSGFAGKFNYVSPEQLGLFEGEVTAKSDIYSLGLVLVECLCGRPIDMGGSQVDVVEKRRVLPDLSGVDVRLRPLIESMLQPDPKHRLESMAAVAAWRPEPKIQSTGHLGLLPKIAGRRMAVGAIATAVLLLVGGVGIYRFDVGRLSWFGSGVKFKGPVDELARRRREEQDERRRFQETQRTGAADGKIGGGLAPSERPLSDRKERIANFIALYDGGDCFFVAPVTVADAKTALEGYGKSAAPFEVLDYEFKRSQGFEAAVGFHTVTEKQCPAINLAARLRHQRGPAPNLDLNAGSLRSDGFFNGSVSELGGRSVELLMVDHDGIVQSLTKLLKGSGAIRSFTVNIRREDAGPPKLQLLLAVLSAQPLDSLKPQSGTSEIGNADKVFSRALEEAQRSAQSLSVSVKSFNLEK